MDTVLVRDVMTGDLVCVDADAALVEASRLMRSHDIDELLVTDGTTLIGTLTAYELVARGLAEDLDPHAATVRDLLGRELVTVHADDDITEALRLMALHGLGRLPVCEAGRVVGVVSRADLDRDELADYQRQAAA
ncbi:CBS domain-containing protein [Catellatospora sp. KI3]|uniref:CBS domain-containing protein n=1 Tax=Catellatospora sp. KI3 TaxID=3041620 RepID=UPI0024821F4D|nr:CBS domain-containing protein [Catellatospora sp. KI3]MDI1460681.1 CBS domain-containing protein [Catellatospora sp. KI3]